VPGKDHNEQRGDRFRSHRALAHGTVYRDCADAWHHFH
jgi:hypothetical protein